MSFGTSPANKRANIDHLEARELERLRLAGALFVDPGRVRPRYFDGRYFAASDVERDQHYFFDRQRELSELAGAGILTGLDVRPLGDSALSISTGVGITRSGELVIVPDVAPTTTAREPLTVDLVDVPTIQRLSYELGVLDAPNRPLRQPSGVFVLALRAVQYTANPQGAYPATLGERRTVEDGDVIEAVLVTLIPYPDEFADLDPGAQRSQLARAIFVQHAAEGAPADVVPLAMLQLSGGRIAWLDTHLVRRELGPEHASANIAGPRNRALHEAHALQYQRQLDDVLAQRARDGQNARFFASEVFAALPPVGPLPSAAVDFARASQLWFPPSVQASLAFVPADEIAVLVEESLLLPAIDLQAPAEVLGATAVLILAPRPRFAAPSDVPELPSAPPLTRSGGLTRSLADLVRNGFPGQPPRPPAATPGAGTEEPPPSAPADLSLLWYVRCRTQYLLPDARVIFGAGG